MTGARSASIFGTMLAFAMIAFALAPAGAADSGEKSALAQVRAGYTDLKKKRYNDAIKDFSAALATGKLKRNEMAKALYYRGIAFRKTKQATKAITDFSRALWLKGALSDTERTDAQSQRKAAYAEAGGSSAAPVIDSRTAAAQPKPTKRAVPTGKRAKAVAKAKPDARSNRAAAGPWQTSTTPRPAQAPQRQASSSNPVSSFFSNLFGGGGGGAKSNLTAAPPRTTASVPRVSSWSSTTQGPSASSSGFRTKTQRAKRRRVRQGRFVIQVAALRSQREADKVARRLASRFGGTLGGRRPVIERHTVGNMGALYHVKVPGFRTRSAASPVCRKLRAGGLDCLVQKRGG